MSLVDALRLLACALALRACKLAQANLALGTLAIVVANEQPNNTPKAGGQQQDHKHKPASLRDFRFRYWSPSRLAVGTLKPHPSRSNCWTKHRRGPWRNWNVARQHVDFRTVHGLFQFLAAGAIGPGRRLGFDKPKPMGAMRARDIVADLFCPRLHNCLTARAGKTNFVHCVLVPESSALLDVLLFTIPRTYSRINEKYWQKSDRPIFLCTKEPQVPVNFSAVWTIASVCEIRLSNTSKKRKRVRPAPSSLARASCLCSC